MPLRFRNHHSFILARRKWSFGLRRRVTLCLCPPSPARMVASYLVHHSYCATAEAFAKSTDQAVQEELASIKSRQSELLFVFNKVPAVVFLSVPNFHDIQP